MLTQEIADKVRRLLDKYQGLVLAYLFGSQAQGNAGLHSDYDFAVLIDEQTDLPALRARLGHDLGTILGTHKVDIVILNRAPIELAYSVISQGKTIYRRDEAARVEFESSVLGRYGDYLPVLRAQRADIYRGGEHAARVQRYREALGRTEREIGTIRAAKSEAAG